MQREARDKQITYFKKHAYKQIWGLRPKPRSDTREQGKHKVKSMDRGGLGQSLDSVVRGGVGERGGPLIDGA